MQEKSKKVQKVRETTVELEIPVEEKLTKKAEVFYNPIMKFNRDISILLLNAIDKTNLEIADILAGSGVRSIRFLLELSKEKIKRVWINDYSADAVENIMTNIELNEERLKKHEPDFYNKFAITHQDACIFLRKSFGFDYIDIDPFGCPNRFLDAAVNRISRDGIIAVTATDTSALCGTYPKACLRKYWAVPRRDYLLHEFGLRILIRKVQLIGAQYDKALFPVFSYSKDHYMRIFFLCKKGKSFVNSILKQHKTIESCGPLWTGELWNQELAENIYKLARTNNYLAKENRRFLETIKDESKIKVFGFHDIHYLCKKLKTKSVPRKEEIIKKIRKKGFKVSSTIFSQYGLRSDIGEEEFKELLFKN